MHYVERTLYIINMIHTGWYIAPKGVPRQTYPLDIYKTFCVTFRLVQSFIDFKRNQFIIFSVYVNSLTPDVRLRVVHAEGESLLNNLIYTDAMLPEKLLCTEWQHFSNEILVSFWDDSWQTLRNEINYETLHCSDYNHSNSRNTTEMKSVKFWE